MTRDPAAERLTVIARRREPRACNSIAQRLVARKEALQ